MGAPVVRTPCWNATPRGHGRHPADGSLAAPPIPARGLPLRFCHSQRDCQGSFHEPRACGENTGDQVNAHGLFLTNRLLAALRITTPNRKQPRRLGKQAVSWSHNRVPTGQQKRDRKKPDAAVSPCYHCLRLSTNNSKLT